MQREYPQSSLQKFKACAEKLSANSEVSEKCVSDFAKLQKDDEIHPQQIYNADETSMFWRCLPHNTPNGTERVVNGVTEFRERLTVFINAHATGTQISKQLMIRKSAQPHAFKIKKTMPMLYKANKQA